MVSAGFFHVYEQLGPGIRASERGEAADVVIMDGGAAEALIKRGLARPGSTFICRRSRCGS
jgi:hypothetical protein